MATNKRGPRVGDAASLWNFTPSPGWSKDEVYILKLCLMKYGVGSWKDISLSGHLPGKANTQLTAQTQRLLGQQQLSGLSGLKVDVDRVRADNEAKEGVTRKGGLIVNNDKNPTKDYKKQLRAENLEKYALTPQQEAEVEELLQQHLALLRPKPETVHILTGDTRALTRDQLQAMLTMLKARIQWLSGRIERIKAGTLKPGDLDPEDASAGGAEAGPSGAGGKAPGGEEAARAAEGAGPGPAAAAVAALPSLFPPPTSGKGAASAKKENAGGKKRKGTEFSAGEGAPAAKKKATGGSGKGGRKASALADRSNSPLGKRGAAALDEEDYEDDEVAMAAREAALTQLMEMGFDRRKASKALDLHGDEVDAALNYLMASC